MKKSSSKQIQWINCAKVVAILAVITNHVDGIVYSRNDVLWGSFFSVSLFILLLGLTSYMTGEKYETLGYFRTFWLKSRKVILAYLIASAVYIAVDYRFFDLTTYIRALIHFDATGPLYYVLLYLQLMVLYKPVYTLVKRIPKGVRGVLAEIGIAVLLLVIGSITTNYTNILNVYGGGGKLFGGTYLFLFYLGMIAEKHQWFRIRGAEKSVIFFILFFVLWILWWRFLYYDRLALDERFAFGIGFNPPGVSLMVSASLMLGLCFGFFTLIERNTFGKYVENGIGKLGQHTLYIFLYHKLFLTVLLHFDIEISVPWLNLLFYYAFMILGSLGAEFVITHMIQLWERGIEKSKG